MGSWDVSCHLSGLHIGCGDKAVLVALKPRTNAYDNELSELRKFGKSSLISNEGANLYFQEALFPIQGVYDDYGRISDIVADDNTKALEEYYGLPIDEIAGVLTDGRADDIFVSPSMSDSSGSLDMTNPKHADLISLSAMWIHGEVYERLAKSRGSSDEDSIDMGNRLLLESVGFIFEGQDTTRDRFDEKFVKDGFVVWSDGTWTDANIFSPQDLKESAAKEGVVIDITPLVSRSYYTQKYDFEVLPKLQEMAEAKQHIESVKETLKNTKADDEAANEAIEKYIRVMERMRLDRHSAAAYLLLQRDWGFETKPNVKSLRESWKSDIKNRKSYGSKVSRKRITEVNKILTQLEAAGEPQQISEFYGEKIIENGNGYLRQNISDWFTVKSYFFSSGRFLYPIGTSPQHGDDEAVLTLLEVARDICKREVDEWKKEVAEDEAYFAEADKV
jgi:hypothetical protein